MRTKLGRLVGTALASAVMLATPQSSAYAAASDCPSDHVCMWEDSNYGGDMWVRYRQGTISQDKYEIDWWNGDNEISSIVNNTDKYLIVYKDDNWNGATRCYSPHSKASTLGTFNDDIESFVLFVNCDLF